MRGSRVSFRSLYALAYTLGIANFGQLAPLGAQEVAFPYKEASHLAGKLQYVKGLPVLLVQGTPEEIGEQVAALTAKDVGGFLEYPKQYLKSDPRVTVHKADPKVLWRLMVGYSKAQLLPYFPPDYRKEIGAATNSARVKAPEINDELLNCANTILDFHNAGCATLIVEPSRSQTGELLFGRNVDFPTLNILQKYNLVIVCRPNGKRPFASVGFPGIVGCISGMNDAGLTVCALEIYDFDRSWSKIRGMPYAMYIRRILEECATIHEVEGLMNSREFQPRSYGMFLAVSDTQRGAVLQVDRETVRVIPAIQGLSACTNYLVNTDERRLALDQAGKQAQLEFSDVQDALKRAAVKLGSEGGKTLDTFQTMIFEPATLKLHLAIGKIPSTEQPLVELDLKPLLAGK